MTLIIGLGGTGTKFVRACIDAGHKFEAALTIDNTSAPIDTDINVKHLQLISESEQLQDVIDRGISLSINSDHSQERLKELASWRPDSRNLALTLQAGAGQIRAVGRSISIAKYAEMKRTIDEFLRVPVFRPQIIIATSTDGGTGSSLLHDVIEICSNDIYGGRDIGVFLFDSLSLDFGTTNLASNSFHTLSEMTHEKWTARSAQDGSVTVHILQTTSSSQIQDSFRFFHLGGDVSFSIQNERLYIEGGALKIDHSNFEDVLEAALTRSASRLFHSIRRLEDLKNSLVWTWGRSKPLLESIALHREQIIALITGWLSLSSRGLVSISEGFVLLTDRKQTHKIPLLRPTTEQPVDALPIALESIAIGLRLRKEDPSTYDAINYLLQAAKEFKPVPQSWSASTSEVLNSSRQLGEDLAAYYGKLAVNVINESSNTSITSDDQILFVAEQLTLAEEFSREPYDGSERILPTGQAIPDMTLFRDISYLYSQICREFVETAQEIVHLKTQQKMVFEKVESQSPVKSHRQSRRIYAKPGMWIRLGLPAALALISIVGTITFLISSHLRNIWADTASAVGGIMGSVAVCLGAVALIWSIQNSSVETARTDRLFTACLGIQEMSLMLRIALQNAIATNDARETGAELWQHQSLHLAAYLLGQRIIEALDSGLFGLLAAIDEDKGIGADLPMNSASRRVFVLLDDLVRVAPEIISDKETEIREKPANPERVLELAEQLRQTVEPITYRYMADTLRRTPVSVR